MEKENKDFLDVDGLVVQTCDAMGVEALKSIIGTERAGGAESLPG